MSVEQRSLVIGIVGPTGGGKSTLADRLGEHLGWRVHREVPEDNPHLIDFYDDLDNENFPSEAALASQLFFLTQAHEQSMSLSEEDDGVIWDMPHVGHLMYARLLFDSGVLGESGFEKYMDKYKTFLAEARMPDLLVVVLMNPEVQADRIRERGRDYEQETDSSYWLSQYAYWVRQVEEKKNVSPMVVLSSSDLNWRSDEGVEEVWSLMQAELKIK